METTNQPRRSNPTSRRSNRFLVGVGVVAVALAAGTLVLQGLRSSGLEPGSPEEAAVRFTEAVLGRDYGAAHDLLTPAQQDECALTTFQTWWSDDATTIVVDNVVARTEAATVWVSMSTLDPYDFPLDPLPDYHDHEAWVSLERIDGE